MTPRIVGVQVGLPREMVDDGGPWLSGIAKQSVVGPVRVGTLGLEGDGQADLRVHGGPDKAICVYPAVHYAAWHDQLGEHGMPFGGFGENLTVDGAAEPDLCIGDVLALGDLRVQVSQPRQPCWKLARRWGRPDFAVTVQESGRTGWYFRVLSEGWLEVGAELTLAERPHPEWSLERANQVMHVLRDDHDAARQLAGLPPLSASWRASLLRRVDEGASPDASARLQG